MSRRGIRSTKPKAVDVTLPFELWPDADRILWGNARRDDLLDGSGFGRNWRPATAEKYIREYGRWLAWLRRHEPGALNIPPLDRITRDRVRVYVAHLKEIVAPYSVASFLRGLSSTAWAFSESDDYYWIVRFAERLKYRAVSVRNKRQIMKPTYDLVSLGIKLMEQAEAQPVRYSSAVKFRNGLLIALLAYRPVRRSNLTNIEIGRHLVKHDGGYLLRYAAEETKQGKALEVSFPDKLVGALETYLGVYRPILMARPPFAGTAGNVLWVANDGAPLWQWGVYAAIRKATAREFGHALNPHIFRDCAATTVALDDPSQIAIVADILGHSNLETSARHYNQARCIDASRRFQDHLKMVRRPSRKAPLLRPPVSSTSNRVY